MPSILTHAALFAALPWQAIAQDSESGGMRFVHNLGACRSFSEDDPRALVGGSHDEEFILHKKNPTEQGHRTVTDLAHCEQICSNLSSTEQKTCYGIEYIINAQGDGIDQCEVWIKPILHAEVIANKKVNCEVYATLEHELEAVYDWEDTVNNQNTYHFEPAWDHGGTTETQKGIQFYAYRHWSPFTEPVYAHWDKSDGQHTVRFYGPHDGERIDSLDPQFYAFRYQIHSALGAVYSWWNENHNGKGSGNHDFHFEPSWHQFEQREGDHPAFWAFRTEVRPGEEFTEAAMEGACRGAAEDDNNASHYNEHNGAEYAPLGKCMEKCVQTEGCTGIEHSPTFGGGRCEVWTRVEGIGATFANGKDQDFSCYHYRLYPDYSTMAVVPIHEWWDFVNKQHTYHYPPAWKHGSPPVNFEQQENATFWAHGREHPNSTAIYDFWDGKQHVFHPLPAAAGETKGTGAPFYVYTNETKDMHSHLKAVYMFLATDDAHTWNTYHFMPKRDNEEVVELAFWAWQSQEDAESDLGLAKPVAEPEDNTTIGEGGGVDEGEGGEVGEFGSGVQQESITLDGDYDTVVGDNKTDFLEKCSAEFAPVECVDVKPGSIIVDVRGTLQDLIAAVEKIEEQGFDLQGYPKLQATEGGLPVIELNITINDTDDGTEKKMKKAGKTNTTESNARGVAGSMLGLLAAVGVSTLLQAV